MEESTRKIESHHLLARWLRTQGSRGLRFLRQVPWQRRFFGPLAAGVGLVAGLIAIWGWWQSRPAPLPELRIVELVPDPVGSDAQCERIRVQNFGDAPVDLRGWRVRDASHATWALDPLGSLAPGQSKTLWREGRGMSLNNTGDHVELLDARGRVLQEIPYPKVLEGETVLVTSRGVETRFVETRLIDEPIPEGSTKEPELCRSEPVPSLPSSPPTASSPSF